MNDLSGRIALVTGGGTGLGRSISLKLAERGATVLVNYSRSAAEAEETVASIAAAGSQGRAVQADVSTPEGAAALRAAVEPFGRLDILACNAGITKQARNHADLDALSKEDFLGVYAVNVVGPFLAMQALKPLLFAAHEASGRASAVVNTSSIAGLSGIGSSVAYAASKGALNTMTISLARALAPAIRVNAVCPGFIGTRWFRDSMDEETYAATVRSVEERTALAAASGPDEIADVAVFLATDASRHMTGELLRVDAGLHLGPSPLRRGQ